jgi:GTPase SAR1 family protein
MCESLFISLPDVEESAGIPPIKLEKQISSMDINLFAKIDAQHANLLSLGKRCSLPPMIIARSVPILPHYAPIPDDVIKANTFGETWNLNNIWARKKAFTELTDPNHNQKYHEVMTSDFEQLYPDELESFSSISNMYLDAHAKKKIEFLTPIRVGYRSLYIHKRDLRKLTTNKSYDELAKELDKINEQLTHYKKQASTQLSLPEGTNHRLVLACELNSDPEWSEATQQDIQNFLIRDKMLTEKEAIAIAYIITRKKIGRPKKQE